MLCASTGEHIVDTEGLSTVACFEFLQQLKQKYPDHKFVGFGFNYDVNMMLKDVPKTQLQWLWKDSEGMVVLDNTAYHLSWIPSKMFRIKSKVSVQIQDTFGFFQTSFIKALLDWNIPGGKEVMERIESGKQQRSEFTTEDIPEMLRYCHDECEMLVLLMEDLQEALREAEIYLKNWQGAGSVAAALFQKYQLREYHVSDDELDEKLRDAVMYAYFGGRFQMLQQGRFKECYNYDLISAYPSEARNLPDLHGEWKQSKYDKDAPYAIWLCEWELPDSRPIMPFPYRDTSGQILYPAIGKGWYWQDEVRAALAMHPEIRVLRGYVFTPDATKRPFWYIDMLATKRLAAKKEGRAVQKVYKLGLNSLYGKLAQGMGYRGSTPPHRSYVWAGMITSNTRARLLEYSMGYERNVIAYATDGIFFDCNPNLPTSDVLGGLELVGDQSEFYMFASGIYFDGDASVKFRTRGHNPKDIDSDTLVEAWKQEGPEYEFHYPATRFYGLGVSLMLKDFSRWRKWITEDRTLSFNHTGRMLMVDDNGEIQIPGVDVHEYPEVVRWQHWNATKTLGSPYIPKSNKLHRMRREDRVGQLSLQLDFDQQDLKESIADELL